MWRAREGKKSDPWFLCNACSKFNYPWGALVQHFADVWRPVIVHTHQLWIWVVVLLASAPIRAGRGLGGGCSWSLSLGALWWSGLITGVGLVTVRGSGPLLCPDEGACLRQGGREGGGRELGRKGWWWRRGGVWFGHHIPLTISVRSLEVP